MLGKCLEVGEAEGDQSAARRRRRIEGDARAVMPPIKRLAQLDAVAREIVLGELAAGRQRLRHDGLADIAVQEEPRAVLGEPFEAFGKLGVAEGLAGRHRLAARREDARHALAGGQDRGDHGEEIGLERAQRETCAASAHRRLDQALHRQLAERRVDGEQARHHAGRGARAEPDMKLLLGRAEIGVDRKELDLARRPALERRLGEEIEQARGVAPGPARHEKAAAAGRGEHRLGDEGHEHAGKRRIEGVAAVLQDFRCGRRGQLMPRGDDAFALAHARWPKGKRVRRQDAL